MAASTLVAANGCGGAVRIVHKRSGAMSVAPPLPPPPPPSLDAAGSSCGADGAGPAAAAGGGAGAPPAAGGRPAAAAASAEVEAAVAAAADLPRRAGLVVHEIFGTDPFSEQLLPTMAHVQVRMRAYVRPCVHACVRACMQACGRPRGRHEMCWVRCEGRGRGMEEGGGRSESVQGQSRHTRTTAGPALAGRAVMALHVARAHLQERRTCHASTRHEFFSWVCVVAAAMLRPQAELAAPDALYLPSRVRVVAALASSPSLYHSRFRAQPGAAPTATAGASADAAAGGGSCAHVTLTVPAAAGALVLQPWAPRKVGGIGGWGCIGDGRHAGPCPCWTLHACCVLHAGVHGRPCL